MFLVTKRRTFILSVKSSASRVAAVSVSRRKLHDGECSATTFRKAAIPLAPLKRLSDVDLPSASGFDKPFAAGKFE